MPTERQDRLADGVIENASLPKPKTKKELLVSAGYDETTATANPGRILDQKGVREALIAKGFSVDNADKVVANILTDEDEQAKDRLKAAELVYKRHPGALQPEAPPPQHNQFNFFVNPKAKQAIQDFESAFIEQLYVQAPQETSLPLEAEQGGSNGTGQGA